MPEHPAPEPDPLSPSDCYSKVLCAWFGEGIDTCHMPYISWVHESFGKAIPNVDT